MSTAEDWETIATGWASAGTSMPRFGSLAWLALPAEDPVKAAVTLAADLGVDTNLRRYGPSVAFALARMSA